METTLQLLLVTVSLVATTSADGEYIRFKFNLDGLYSGTGLVSDSSNEDASWCKVILIQEPQSLMNLKGYSQYTRNRATNWYVSPTKWPHIDFDVYTIAWVAIKDITFQKAENGEDLEFSYCREVLEYCCYKVQFGDKVFIRPGLLVSDPGAKAYFLPNTLRDDNGDLDELEAAMLASSANFAIYDISDSRENCPVEISNKWLPIEVEKIVPNQRTRIYFNTKLYFKMVSTVGETETFGSLLVSRMRITKHIDSWERFAPLRWSGLLSIIAAQTTDSELDINTLCQNPTKQISVRIVEKWYQLTAIRKNLNVDVDALFLTELKGEVVNKLLLTVGVLRFGNDFDQFFGYVTYEANGEEAKAVQMTGNKLFSKTNYYPSSSQNSLTLTNMSLNDCADDMAYAALAAQTLDYGYHKNSALQWVPICITRVVTTRDGLSSKLVYTELEIFDVSFKIVNKTHKKQDSFTSGAVKVQRLKSPEMEFSGITAPSGWKGNLLLTEFTVSNNQVEINELVQNGESVCIFVENQWWFLERKAYMCWDLESSFVATVAAKYVNTFALMIRRNNTDQLVLVENITESNIEKGLFWLTMRGQNTFEIEENATTEIQRTAIAFKKLEYDSTGNKDLHWELVYGNSLRVVDMEEGRDLVLEFTKGKEMKVRVVIVDFSGITPDAREKSTRDTLLCFDCQGIAEKAKKEELQESKREVLFKFDFIPNLDYTKVIGETAKIQLFVGETSDEGQLAKYRLVIKSQFMYSSHKFIATLETKQVLDYEAVCDVGCNIQFWMQPAGKSFRYVVVATIDEMERTITIDPSAKALEFDLVNHSPSLKKPSKEINWKKIVRNEYYNSKHKFGMHRMSKNFALVSCINLVFIYTNYGWFGCPDQILIHYVIGGHMHRGQRPKS